MFLFKENPGKAEDAPRGEQEGGPMHQEHPGLDSSFEDAKCTEQEVNKQPPRCSSSPSYNFLREYFLFCFFRQVLKIIARESNV